MCFGVRVLLHRFIARCLSSCASKSRGAGPLTVPFAGPEWVRECGFPPTTAVPEIGAVKPSSCRISANAARYWDATATFRTGGWSHLGMKSGWGAEDKRYWSRSVDVTVGTNSAQRRIRDLSVYGQHRLPNCTCCSRGAIRYHLPVSF